MCCFTLCLVQNTVIPGSTLPLKSSSSNISLSRVARSIVRRTPLAGADDHVHIACSLSRTISISKLVQEIKQDSSKWIKTKGARFAEFAWQNGYGVFSIGQSQLVD